MNIEFPGQTVIVTGAAHGFGRAIALAFAQRGARVWACDRLAGELEETARLAAEAGGDCVVRTVDVTDREAIFAFVREAEAASAEGRVDVLVNNAGGVVGQVGRPLGGCRSAGRARPGCAGSPLAIAGPRHAPPGP